ncbi:hypothetical protein MPTK1_3g07220 [Marchantia polymorpha subsp. ruderalis]|uniref:Uncharacterized protein n=2 Tax=Marchantia polymorpha TaxID=3197 RepID=A0AAF6AYA1_MARPO|nr:hypothetical protein MARPO_0006s0195 [Marchantia polymorpha]BBN04735.1 hypothetical protein Mp_3g07220 [Marchantia polymorpha subsp. ruderalis]|eukprot:PTQ48179.1 hypothetical protein MARPO_0006s0195 [Marchantia polymorpha]
MVEQRLRYKLFTYTPSRGWKYFASIYPVDDIYCLVLYSSMVSSCYRFLNPNLLPVFGQLLPSCGHGSVDLRETCSRPFLPD